MAFLSRGLMYVLVVLSFSGCAELGLLKGPRDSCDVSYLGSMCLWPDVGF